MAASQSDHIKHRHVRHLTLSDTIVFSKDLLPPLRLERPLRRVFFLADLELMADGAPPRLLQTLNEPD